MIFIDESDMAELRCLLQDKDDVIANLKELVTELADFISDEFEPSELREDELAMLQRAKEVDP